MVRLTPGSLSTRLRELGHAGYVRTGKTGSRVNALTTAALTHQGRGTLGCYTAVLRQLPAGAAGEVYLAPAPEMRVSDADRDAAAAALGEHFAQGRLTLDELDARLDAALTATTQGEITQATRDLPDVTVLSDRPPVTSSRLQRARRGRRPGLAASHGTLPPYQTGGR